MKEEKLYTTGEFAKKAGVTIRTIRYYDTKGILKPSHHNNQGHRLYSEQDFLKLKQILVLKYLGLSLDEVMEIETQSFGKDDMANSFKLQKNIIKNKINHMKIILDIIETAETSMESAPELDLNNTIDIIKILESEEQLLQQYIDSSNLNANIILQEKFSSNKDGWYNWVFRNMDLNKKCRVLEIGCGNGALWLKNLNNIDIDIDITLTDICQDMIDEAKGNLEKYNKNLSFKRINPNDIPFEDESFDIVIANHILFYMNDLDKVLSEIHRVLKKKGQFYCSTIGNDHMRELEQLLLGFNEKMKISEERLSAKFGIDNAELILNKYFENIDKYLYKDNLIVNDTKAILEYIYTIPGNILEIVDNKKKDFEFYIDKNIKKSNAINITNSHILFKSNKL